MKRYEMAQMNQSNRTDAAACAPACSCARKASASHVICLDAAILAVSIAACRAAAASLDMPLYRFP